MIFGRSKRITISVLFGLLALIIGATTVFAADPSGAETMATAEDPNGVAITFVWLMVCATLVFFMQAGFAFLEAGFTRTKNTVNVLTKNFMDFCIGGIAYFVFGYAIMYGTSIGGFIGSDGFLLLGDYYDVSTALAWFFQMVFAATATTIVSGAMAERTKITAYLAYSFLISAIIYPISGHWVWGGGWLAQMGFHDFAGSGVVHMIGGMVALTGAYLVGPRNGKYNKDGTPNEFKPTNVPYIALGGLILFVGWFGFNPGSQLAFAGAANTDAVMLIATNTLLAACAGAVFAMLAGMFTVGKPDLGYALNGMLAGLVGITANCDSVSNISAIIIGVVAGVLVVVGMMLLEKLRIDDPVGAWPVHGLCGIWGGLATAIFGSAAGHTLGAQIIGSIAIPVWAFVTCYILFMAIKAAGILRVSEEEELEGLDITEHGTINYPEFTGSLGSATAK
ncbi:MAG: ammonium transporter [Anaerolineae bacterium]|nr:ammonium transporter [Anaerolineae bacterium]